MLYYYNRQARNYKKDANASFFVDCLDNFFVFKKSCFLQASSIASMQTRVFRYKTICNERPLHGFCARSEAVLCGMPDVVLHNSVAFGIRDYFE